MALTPQNPDAFFREVDEEVRREQMRGFWSRYGRLVAVLLVVALLALAAYLWWQHRRTEAAGADGATLTQALAELGEGRTQAAQPKLEALARSPRDGYQASARLTLATVALGKGDVKAAATQYAAVAADASLPRPFRDLALIRQTAAEFDGLPPAQVIARLRPLAVPGNAWFGSAAELVAAAQAKAGDRAAAGRTLAAVARDPQTPESLRTRATRLAGVYGTMATPAAAAR